MKKVSTTKKAAAIPANEKELAAMYFALSNTAMLNEWDTDIRQAYYEAESTLWAECGADLEAEKKDWDKAIKRGDKFCVTEWNAVRGKYTKHTMYGERINKA